MKDYLICPYCQMGYTLIPGESRVKVVSHGNQYRIVEIVKCGPCIEEEKRRIIYMKKYCLNYIMTYRNQMGIRSIRPDWMRIVLIKIWLEQYFLVEKRFGDEDNA